VAFAANSLLARAAIDPSGAAGASIGPVAFTALRLAAGALVLAPWWLRVRSRPSARDWLGPALLTAYALPFALAYVGVGAAVGALVLFGAVQATMLAAGAVAGERMGWRGAIGLGGAVGGVVLLLLPGVVALDPAITGAGGAPASAVPIGAALLMVVAGVAWGAYSLAGRGTADPAAATARAFGWSLPVALALAAWPGAWIGVRVEGVVLAVVSGALTSGLGYVVWYRAVPHLTRTSAAVVQLLVPVVAALGAVALLGEAITLRLALAAALVLGGVGTVVLGQQRSAKRSGTS
jgi:drug/metabolite transporter (DMT)-like permease